jgi:hypothetical protein
MKTNVDKQNLIWGILLIVFGVAAFIESFTDLTNWGWVAILFAAGVFTAGVSWSTRSKWAYLIPTYVLWSVAGLIALITLDFLRKEAIATYVLAAIAIPFVVAFLRNKSLWGLLIPAYVLFAVGIMVGLIGLGWLYDLLIPVYIMFAIAIPFFIVYVRNPKNWWALIPGGIMGVIGFSFMLATPSVRYIVPIAMVLIGIWILFRQFIRRS